MRKSPIVCKKCKSTYKKKVYLQHTEYIRGSGDMLAISFH